MPGRLFGDEVICALGRLELLEVRPKGRGARLLTRGVGGRDRRRASAWACSRLPEAVGYGGVVLEAAEGLMRPVFLLWRPVR